MAVRPDLSALAEAASSASTSASTPEASSPAAPAVSVDIGAASWKTVSVAPVESAARSLDLTPPGLTGPSSVSVATTCGPASCTMPVSTAES